MDPTMAGLGLTGAVVAVTGATGGIGSGIARRFSAAGAHVVAHHRASPVRAQELCDELCGPATPVAVELADPDGARQLVDQAVAAFGTLDVLINNAAIQPVALLEDVDVEAWDEIMEVNVAAVHRCIQEFARHRREEGGPGAVVNIASIEGIQPSPAHSHYATTKAAVRMYTRASAAELGRDGIRVNVVSPGLIHRAGIDEHWPEGVSRWRQHAPLGRLGLPEEVGDACLFLASSMARFITGAELVVDGGMLTRPTW